MSPKGMTNAELVNETCDTYLLETNNSMVVELLRRLDEAVTLRKAGNDYNEAHHNNPGGLPPETLEGRAAREDTERMLEGWR